MKPDARPPLAEPSHSASRERQERVFLVVVDGSDEQKAAIRFAAQRAKATDGQVALLHAVEPVEFEHWMFVGNLMREEAREEAEHLLNRHASVIRSITGRMPIFHLREGDLRTQMFKLLDEERFSVLILAADTGPDGPGPLVQAITGKQATKLPLPVTIVPGNLTDDQIDALT